MLGLLSGVRECFQGKNRDMSFKEGVGGGGREEND